MSFRNDYFVSIEKISIDTLMEIEAGKAGKKCMKIEAIQD